MCPWQVGLGLQSPKIDDLCALHKHKLSTSLSENAGERDRERTYIPGSDPKIDDHHFRNLNLDLVRGEKESNVNVISSFFATQGFSFFAVLLSVFPLSPLECYALNITTNTGKIIRRRQREGQWKMTSFCRRFSPHSVRRCRMFVAKQIIGKYAEKKPKQFYFDQVLLT